MVMRGAQLVVTADLALASYGPPCVLTGENIDNFLACIYRAQSFTPPRTRAPPVLPLGPGVRSSTAHDCFLTQMTVASQQALADRPSALVSLRAPTPPNLETRQPELPTARLAVMPCYIIL